MKKFVDRHNKDRVENPHYGLRKRPQPTAKMLEHKQRRTVREEEGADEVRGRWMGRFGRG